MLSNNGASGNTHGQPRNEGNTASSCIANYARNREIVLQGMDAEQNPSSIGSGPKDTESFAQLSSSVVQPSPTAIAQHAHAELQDNQWTVSNSYSVEHDCQHPAREKQQAARIVKPTCTTLDLS